MKRFRSLGVGLLLLAVCGTAPLQHAAAQGHHDDYYAPAPYDPHGFYADDPDYYYMPQHGIYYNPARDLYFYPNGSQWMCSSYLPDSYYGVGYGTGVWVNINVRTPWLRHSHWARQYPHHHHGGGYYQNRGHGGHHSAGRHYQYRGHHGATHSYGRGGSHRSSGGHGYGNSSHGGGHHSGGHGRGHH